MNRSNLIIPEISVKLASGWVGGSTRYSTLQAPTMLHPGYTPAAAAVLTHVQLPGMPDGLFYGVGLISVAQLTSWAH